MATLRIDQVDLSNLRVLTRVDFNVPLNADGGITDDRRLRAALPTLQCILEAGGKLILMSHLGRPKGDGFDQAHTLAPVARRLSELLNRPVAFPSQDCIDEETAKAVGSMKQGDVILLENLRFHEGEKKNDLEFAKRLAALADVYCNDAFGTAHRAHASMVGVPAAMPPAAPRVAGFLLEKEIKYLAETIASPNRPFVGILGGAKVTDKILAIENMLNVVDSLLIGGAMAYTFLAAKGLSIGTSLVQTEAIPEAKRLMDEASNRRGSLILPVDHVCSQEFKSGTPVKVCAPDIEDGWMGLDIGVMTIQLFSETILRARTIVWNGPVGVFEMHPFDVGTRCLADMVAAATVNGATSIIGGGDSAAAVEQFKMAEKFSHISTGGGASLQMLEGKALPGLDALSTDG